MEKEKLLEIITKVNEKKMETSEGLWDVHITLLIDFCKMGWVCKYGEWKGWRGFLFEEGEPIHNDYDEKITGIFYKESPTPILGLVVDGYLTPLKSMRVNEELFDKIIYKCTELFNR